MKLTCKYSHSLLKLPSRVFHDKMNFTILSLSLHTGGLKSLGKKIKLAPLGVKPTTLTIAGLEVRCTNQTNKATLKTFN